MVKGGRVKGGQRGKGLEVGKVGRVKDGKRGSV